MCIHTDHFLHVSTTIYIIYIYIYLSEGIVYGMCFFFDEHNYHATETRNKQCNVLRGVEAEGTPMNFGRDQRVATQERTFQYQYSTCLHWAFAQLGMGSVEIEAEPWQSAFGERTQRGYWCRAKEAFPQL